MNRELANLKADIRLQKRKIRDAISAADRRVWDQAILAYILALPEGEKARVIFSYQSQWGEVDTSALVQHFLQQGKRVLTPAPDIKALHSDGLHEIIGAVEGSGGPRLEPSSSVELEEIDLIFVPGIAWDRQGYRIGFGGGYFDRLLGALRKDCMVVGLAYECQLIDQVPRGSWDMPVHKLITQRGIFSPKQG